MENANTTHHGRLPADALSAFEICRDADFDVVRKGLSEVFAYKGHIDPLSPRAEWRPSVLRAIQLTHMTLGVIRFGTKTQIITEPMLAYHVTVPLQGQVLCGFGSRKITVGSGLGAVNTPDQPSLIPQWSADAEVLCIKIRRNSLEDELGAMIGRPVRSVVRIGLGLDLTTAAGQNWSSVLGLLLSELAAPDTLARTSKYHLEQLERLVISSLLLAQSHNFSDEVWSDTGPVRWRSVKRAIEAIEGTPDKPWSLTQLAEIAGVSGRRLQQGFQAQVGMSPMAYLQNVRLERVHRDLLKDMGQVTDLCMQWGFTHLGRFAGAYRARYGESPRETRRRCHSTLL